MIGRSSHDRVVPVHNLQDYFRTSIDSVIVKQGVDVDPHAAHYVVNLLTLFSRSDEFYEPGDDYSLHKPLALMLADAVDAATLERRNYALQRIGDVALFVAGFFADSLMTKAVDLDYYIHMGGNAYGSLSEEVRGTFRGNAFAPIYRELAAKFQVLVDILNEISEGPPHNSDINILRTYKVWLKTGSARAEKLLREHGVVPIADGKAKRRH